jgi:hypothetical protein
MQEVSNRRDDKLLGWPGASAGCGATEQNDAARLDDDGLRPFSIAKP